MRGELGENEARSDNERGKDREYSCLTFQPIREIMDS